MSDRIIVLKPYKNESHLPDEVLEDVVRKLGSEYRGQTILRPLSKQEEEQWLYDHIGADERDRDFGEKIRKYWIDMTIKVEAGGKTLNIGTNSNGDPINFRDYFEYRFAKKHSLVADSFEEGDGNPNKKFYIHDPEVEKQQENKNVQFRKKAYKHFTIISENPQQMDYVLRVMGEPRVDNLTSVEKENLLSNILDSDPKRFIRVVEDDDLEVKSLIEELLEANVLERIGTSYIYFDKTLAETKKEMVQFLKSSKNSKLINELKARLKKVSPV